MKSRSIAIKRRVGVIRGKDVAKKVRRLRTSFSIARTIISHALRQESRLLNAEVIAISPCASRSR